MRHSESITNVTAFIFCMIVLFFAACQSDTLAGPTTADLLEQIKALQKQVDAIQSRAFLSKLLSVSEYEDCEVDEYGIDCEDNSTILISINEGQETNLEIYAERYVSQNGEPELIQYTYTLSIVKVVNTPTDPNHIETVQDFVVWMEVINGEDTIVFEISPTEPLYSLTDDDPAYDGPLTIKASLVADSLIAVNEEGNILVKQIKTESIGAIVEASIEPYCASDSEATLNVHIGNYGDLKSDYITTVTQTDPAIAPVSAQFKTIEPYEEPDLEFTLSTTGTFDSSQTCLVTLKSTTGRIYDEVTVNFPEPLPDCPDQLDYIPDFDGDGDVDMLDFCDFASYYLIGTDD